MAKGQRAKARREKKRLERAKEREANKEKDTQRKSKSRQKYEEKRRDAARANKKLHKSGVVETELVTTVTEIPDREEMTADVAPTSGDVPATQQAVATATTATASVAPVPLNPELIADQQAEKDGTVLISRLEGKAPKIIAAAQANAPQAVGAVQKKLDAIAALGTNQLSEMLNDGRPLSDYETQQLNAAVDAAEDAIAAGEADVIPLPQVVRERAAAAATETAVPSSPGGADVPEPKQADQPAPKSEAAAAASSEVTDNTTDEAVPKASEAAAAPAAEQAAATTAEQAAAPAVEQAATEADDKAVAGRVEPLKHAVASGLTAEQKTFERLERHKQRVADKLRKELGGKSHMQVQFVPPRYAFQSGEYSLIRLRRRGSCDPKDLNRIWAAKIESDGSIEELWNFHPTKRVMVDRSLYKMVHRQLDELGVTDINRVQRVAA